MPDRDASLADVVAAIQDQTRVFLALSEKYPTKTERVRKLGEVAIPPSRIAALLGMPLRDVTSALSKAKKRASASDTASEIESNPVPPDSGEADESR